MIIYDYKTPGGRSLEMKHQNQCPDAVSLRYLTEEERKEYGFDSVVVVKKCCAHCHEIKSDYAFFYSKSSPDGLSSWCRRCFYQHQQKEESYLEKILRKRGKGTYESKRVETV